MSIRRCDFDLRNSDERRRFLLDLYNLKQYSEDFESSIDYSKLEKLVLLNNKASELDTETKAKSSQISGSQAKSGPGNPGSFPNACEDQTDTLYIKDIQDILYNWGVEDFFPLTTVSNSDMVRNTSLLIPITESLSGKNVVQ